LNSSVIAGAVVVPPDGGCWRLREGRDRTAARRRGSQARIVGEDRLLQLPERGHGLEAELVHERHSRCSVGLERVGLPVAAIERQHELAAHALAQRMLPHQGLELADELRVPSAGEVGVYAVFKQGEPQLFETRDLRLRERLEGELAQWRPAPQPERLSKQHGCPLAIFGRQCLAGLVSQALAPVEVKLARLHVKQVAIGPGRHPVGAVSKSLAEARHLDLKTLSGVPGRLLAPELVDQLIGRDRLVGMNQEDREQRPLPVADDGDRPPGLVDLERAEDPEIHRPTLPP
jgi:hypothetical protein